MLPYAHAQALESALPTATFLTLEGTGHELHRADWPAILDAVEQHTAPQLRRMEIDPRDPRDVTAT